MHSDSGLFIADSNTAEHAHMHKSIFTKTDIFHKYTWRNNKWVTVEWAWRNGDRNEKEREEMRSEGKRTKQVTRGKLGKRMKQRRWERRRNGQKGENRLNSDNSRHVRGPYSFTHELNGGKKVRER